MIPHLTICFTVQVVPTPLRTACSTPSASDDTPAAGVLRCSETSTHHFSKIRTREVKDIEEKWMWGEGLQRFDELFLVHTGRNRME